ncbi:hypothetical protein ABIE56_003153 [Luteibacter sp. 621]|uniref:AIPR family protein n=1 Tax=Luteibacter sp. 621 TaxID=3373916 RepID=UPI003D258A92
MELGDFLLQLKADVDAEISERLRSSESNYPYAESVFTEVVTNHMAEVGMTFEPQLCHYATKVANANVRMSAFAVSDDSDQLDLFISVYEGSDALTAISDTETKTAAEHCYRFFVKCVEGDFASTMDETNDAYELALLIQRGYRNLDQIRIFVLTDRIAKTKNFKSREVGGKVVKLEVMDIERLYRHWSAGKPRDELIVNFNQIAGAPLPCVYVPGVGTGYSYAMTAVPGESLRFIYDSFGARLLEANVRSFLSATGKVNKGIRDTLRDEPEKFMAYNNGIVIVADEIRLDRALDGSPGIVELRGMQIVNGGQTTASIYFSKKKNPDIDLTKVRVPAKIIILNNQESSVEEALISDISKYANSQNSVKQSDLSANKPFHVDLEKMASSTYCPDGVGRWFYERSAGSYNVMLAREGSTPAKLRDLKSKVVPPARKISKTDLAKFVNTWNRRPDEVSQGSQKNFSLFMDSIRDQEDAGTLPVLDVTTFKRMIASAILFKKTQALVRPMYPAFQGNIVVYLISTVAEQYGDVFDMDRVWNQQDISPSLRRQLQVWSKETHEALHQTAQGRMISEWAKRAECWDSLRRRTLSPVNGTIPEIRAS